MADIRGLARLIVPLAFAVLAGYVLVHRDDVRPALAALRIWTAGQGACGVVAFGLAYAVAVVCFVPGNLMTPVATALFGPLLAIVVVSTGGTLGATLSFLIARYGAREWVARRFGHHPRFQWLERNTATRGELFVAVARILPIMPGNVLHYAFGLTGVPLGVFVVWSWLGSMPGLVFFVTGLDAVFRVFVGETVPPSLLGALAGLLVVKVLLLTWAARQAGFRLMNLPKGGGVA